MSTARANRSERSELDIAVAKIRAGEPLTEHERAVVNARGMELAELTDEPFSPGEQRVMLGLEEEQALFEALVRTDADEREGRRGIPWRELFPPRVAG
ncbi:MAG: hypothetical protein R2724_34005 [Bryobacterales bacterium]